MKQVTSAVFVLMAISQMAFAASNVRPGLYVGVNPKDGKECYIGLETNSEGKVTSFKLGWKNVPGDGFNGFVNQVSRRGSILSLSGSADFTSASANILIAEDGTPIKANMSARVLLNSSSIQCNNLAFQPRF